jgi:hypothetical protein
VYALGRFTAFLATAMAVVAAVVVLQSIPDIRRYLKMRAM